MHILPITQKINSFSASKYDKKAEGYRGYTAVNPKNSIAKSIRALDKKIITNINNIYLGYREDNGNYDSPIFIHCKCRKRNFIQ